MSYPPPNQPSPAWSPAPVPAVPAWQPPGPPAPVPSASPGRRPLRIVGGLLLLLPALGALALSYVWPTIWNIQKSSTNEHLTGGGSTHGVGLDNYHKLLQGGDFGPAVGFGLSLAAVPLLLVAILAPALAWAAHRSGTAARWIVRVALALPLVAYAPTAMALGWALDHVDLKAKDVYLKSAGDMRTALWLGSFGLVCSVAVTAYLAALRRRDAARRAWPAAAVVGGLLGLATLALGLQQLAYPYLLRRAAGPHAKQTPALLILHTFGETFQVGLAAAAGTLLLILLAVLGVAATALILGSRLRIEFDPKYRSAEQETGWSTPRIVAATGAGILLVAVLVVTAIGLYPWLSRLGGTDTAAIASPFTLLRNTWLPPLLSTAVGVTVAVLAGFGIGALRPLGAYSEVLLLPFAPWLFVAFSPLVAPAWSGSDHDNAGAFVDLIPSSWVSIPALFIATLLFRGQAGRLRASGVRGAGAAVRAFVLPVLPMVVLLFGAVWLWQSQDLMWQEIMSNVKRGPTGPMATLTSTTLYDTRDPLGLVFPAAMLVVFVALAIAAQLGYLDRVAIRVGKEPDGDLLKP